MKTTHIAALGEILIDYTPLPDSEAGMPVFEQNPGGAPANVLACAARLGRSTALIGKVGDDMQGKFLLKRLEENRIDISGVRIDGRYFTTLAFIQLSETGERSFAFARKPGADTQLSPDELNRELLRSSGILHFGSLSLTDEPARSATMEAVREAKGAGAVIAYDPNYRPLLWECDRTAAQYMRMPLRDVDLLKVSDDELPLLTDTEDCCRGARRLLEEGIRCVTVTRGNEGTLVATREGTAQVPAFSARTVDTTGAGDSFWGGFLTCVSESGRPVDQLTLEDFQKFARFGNAVASLCVEKRGAMPAMPSRAEVAERLSRCV